MIQTRHNTGSPWAVAGRVLQTGNNSGHRRRFEIISIHKVTILFVVVVVFVFIFDMIIIKYEVKAATKFPLFFCPGNVVVRE